MSNPHRGEVSFKTPDAEYTLVLSTNALCELEAETNKSLPAILADMERVTTVRALLWALLRTKQPDVTLAQAGEIIDRVGMPKTTEAIVRAIAAAHPKAPKGGTANP
jgi:hypothetical protein